MATNETTETVAVKTSERSWRFEVFTEKDTDYAVRIHREKSTTIGDVTLPAVRGSVVDRRFKDVAAEVFVIGGKSYTGGEVANVLSAIADIWSMQDKDAAAAAAAADAEAAAAASATDATA